MTAPSLLLFHYDLLEPHFTLQIYEGTKAFRYNSGGLLHTWTVFKEILQHFKTWSPYTEFDGHFKPEDKWLNALRAKQINVIYSNYIYDGRISEIFIHYHRTKKQNSVRSFEGDKL